ncbi:MAG: transposase [Sideroxydans sp.]
MELTNDEAFELFKELRWGGGDEVVCPTCGTVGKHYFQRTRKQWRQRLQPYVQRYLRPRMRQTVIGLSGRWQFT